MAIILHVDISGRLIRKALIFGQLHWTFQLHQMEASLRSHSMESSPAFANLVCVYIYKLCVYVFTNFVCILQTHSLHAMMCQWDVG